MVECDKRAKSTWYFFNIIYIIIDQSLTRKNSRCHDVIHFYPTGDISCDHIWEYLESKAFVPQFNETTCLIFDEDSFEGHEISSENAERVRDFCGEKRIVSVNHLCIQKYTSLLYELFTNSIFLPTCSHIISQKLLKKNNWFIWRTQRVGESWLTFMVTCTSRILQFSITTKDSWEISCIIMMKFTAQLVKLS